MMSEKMKNEMKAKPIFGRLSFFLLWVVLAMVFSGVANNLNELIKLIGSYWGVDFFSNQAMTLRYILLTTIVSTALVAPVQKVLLRAAFGKWIKGWVSATILSAALAAMPFILLHQFNQESLYFIEPQRSLVLLITAALPAIPQTWVLRRYVKHAWTFFFTLIFGSYLANSVAELGMGFGLSFGPLAIGAFSALLALTMIFLFRENPSEEKTKVQEASSRLEDKFEDTIDDEMMEEVAELDKVR